MDYRGWCFIVEKSGYIVTSYDVIQGAGTLFVFLSQAGEVSVQHGKEHVAGLVYVNEEADFAILKISPDDNTLPAVTLGDSSNLKIGGKVLAIGCALPYKSNEDIVSFMKDKDSEIDSPSSSTESILRNNYYRDLPKQFQNLFSSYLPVTEGIISSISQGDGLTELQIDRNINRAASGGPLVNSRGEVVGVNTWRLTKSLPEWATEYAQFAQNPIQSSSFSQDIIQNVNVALAIDDCKPPISDMISLKSPPLISNVYCDVRRWAERYEDKETQYVTTLPPCIIIEWTTNEPTTGQVMYIWNPFECPAIFESRRNDFDACIEFCGICIGSGGGTSIDVCRVPCQHPDLRATPVGEQLTTRHKVILPDLSIYEGSYEFKVISRSESGVEVTSDRYRFLWAGNPKKLKFLINTKLVDPYAYHCLPPEKH